MRTYVFGPGFPGPGDPSRRREGAATEPVPARGRSAGTVGQVGSNPPERLRNPPAPPAVVILAGSRFVGCKLRLAGCLAAQPRANQGRDCPNCGEEAGRYDEAKVVGVAKVKRQSDAEAGRSKHRQCHDSALDIPRPPGAEQHVVDSCRNWEKPYNWWQPRRRRIREHDGQDEPDHGQQRVQGQASSAHVVVRYRRASVVLMGPVVGKPDHVVCHN